MTYPYENLYQSLEHNALSQPRKAAIFEENQQTTFRKLKQKVDTFATFLIQKGIGEGDKIGLILENCEEFVISIFAISKIGAIIIPINSFLKYEEFIFILNDSKAKMLLSSAKFAKETASLPNATDVKNIIWVSQNVVEDEHNFFFDNILSQTKIDKNLDHFMPKVDDIATIIYTSGTTGRPKGAMLSYRNLFSNIFGGSAMYDVSTKDRFIVYLPMFHSFTFTVAVLIPLVLGGSIVIVRSVFPFSNVLKQTLLKRVTVFLGIPTVYNALNKAKIPWYFKLFNNIRIFVSGSAPLSQSVVDGFKKIFPKATISEGYGLSECSPGVALNPLNKQKIGSVGKALKNFEIKIVNEEIVEVPRGEIGEIIVKGDCVMQGYLGRIDATDEAIRNGWLFTGDLGKMDEEDYLYIVDRKKEIIISKGINIYPREIEEILSQYPGVNAVAVVGKKDELQDEEVVAFIELKDEVELISEIEIKKYLKKHLANFKIPKQIFTVEELPKNATGKVLKRILKEQLEKDDFLEQLIKQKQDSNSQSLSQEEKTDMQISDQEKKPENQPENQQTCMKEENLNEENTQSEKSSL